MAFVSMIILAAGQGKRMNSGINKQFLMINNKPILVYTLETIVNNPNINEVILVINEKERKMIQDEILLPYFSNNLIQLTYGGKERYDSVYNALTNISEVSDYVLIHDGARPLLRNINLVQIIKALETNSSVVLGVKLKDTCKRVNNDGIVVETISRDSLYTIQTPQGFHKKVIIDAYMEGLGKNPHITDDAMMVELFTNENVKIIEGDYENIKITTPEDLITMEAILNKRRNEIS